MNIHTMSAASGLAMLVASATPSVAQLRYQPTRDTLRYESDNTYLLYFVRGSDTLGGPISTKTQELRFFKANGTNLEAWVGLRGSGFQSDETYTITTNGRLIAVNGQPVGTVASARVDFLPRLPDHPQVQKAGDSWTDSVRNDGTESYGQTYYRVARQYTLQRIVDTMGTTAAVIIGTGQMRLRQGGWQDSTAGVVWWQEVEGPVADTTVFDIRSGQILMEHSTMRLTGRGGAGAKGSTESMPSGLTSTNRLSRAQRD
jgi:hypothetical protein